MRESGCPPSRYLTPPTNEAEAQGRDICLALQRCEQLTRELLDVRTTTPYLREQIQQAHDVLVDLNTRLGLR